MSNLGNQASKCSLDKVADALPLALKKNVLQSLNLSTFVWVIKNNDDANKIVKVLRENGFSNISLDSKGTTITAQSSFGLEINSNNDGCSYLKITPPGTDPCSCNCPNNRLQATNNNCENESNSCCGQYYMLDGSTYIPCISDGNECMGGCCFASSN